MGRAGAELVLLLFSKEEKEGKKNWFLNGTVALTTDHILPYYVPKLLVSVRKLPIETVSQLSCKLASNISFLLLIFPPLPRCFHFIVFSQSAYGLASSPFSNTYPSSSEDYQLLFHFLSSIHSFIIDGWPAYPFCCVNLPASTFFSY